MKCSSQMDCTCKCYCVLKYVADNNGCTGADIFMSTASSGYGKDSIADGIMTCIESGWITRTSKRTSKRTASLKTSKFNVTKLGLDVLAPVKVTADINEFIILAKSIGAQTIEELDVQLALAGSHKYLEADFLKKLHFVVNNTKKRESFRRVTNVMVSQLGLPIVFELYARAKAIVESEHQNKEKAVA